MQQRPEAVGPRGVGMTLIFQCDALQNRHRCDLASWFRGRTAVARRRGSNPGIGHTMVYFSGRGLGGEPCEAAISRSNLGRILREGLVCPGVRITYRNGVEREI